MCPKVFLTAIAQPYPQCLGNLFFLFFGQRVVECQRPIALTSTGGVVVSIPVASGNLNPPTHFLDQCCSCQGFVLLCHI